MLLNASLIGYFTEIGAENKIIGVSSPEYIFSDKIHQFIKDGKIQNIGNEQKYDVEKKTLQNKISEKKWEVSGNIKADITELKTSIGKISGTLGNNPDKAHIIAEDVIDCINQIADLVESEKIVKSATLLNLARTVTYLKNNTKLEKISAGAGVQELVEVGLGSSDFKECQVTIDKASLTLGVNQRHSNSQVNIQNTNATQNNIEINKEIVLKTLQSFDDEY